MKTTIKAREDFTVTIRNNPTQVLSYDKTSYQRFQKDMTKAGYETRHYRGRFFWEGPAVATSTRKGISLQDVLSATKVPLQWDNLGLDYIVYPKG